MSDPTSARSSMFKRYGYAWVTLGFFLISLVGHWIFAWFAYADEQTANGHAIEISGYLNQVVRDTLENWQSEFLQLLWQVGGLAFLLYVGSPQSKEGRPHGGKAGCGFAEARPGRRRAVDPRDRRQV